MQATRHLSRLWLVRPRRFFLLALTGALLLALAGSGLRYLRSTYGPTNGACWIWAAGAALAEQPIAFYAVDEFQLASVEPVWISIAADEGYELYVNGQQAGFGTYRPGATIDRYRVDELVQRGNNRITVRLQSLRGAGGFLATVTAGEPERALTVTSEDWRVFREHDERLFEADAALDGGEDPRVWQRAKTGRWRLRPTTDDRTLPDASMLPAQRVRHFYPRARWFDLRRPRKSPIRFPHKLFDWGEEVHGQLILELASPASEPALAYFGTEVPDPFQGSADAVWLFVPGQKIWRDVIARRFRYALLIGIEPVDEIWVQELPESELTEPGEPTSGLWGVKPPARSLELQESIWTRVQAAAEEQVRKRDK